MKLLLQKNAKFSNTGGQSPLTSDCGFLATHVGMTELRPRFTERGCALNRKLA